jgi:amidase
MMRAVGCRVKEWGDDALGNFDAIGLASAIKSGRVGSAEVVKVTIVRAEAVNSTVSGLVCKVFGQARAEASEAPKDGLFSGVPTFIKDNVGVPGLATMRVGR